MKKSVFNIDCQKCPRYVSFFRELRREFPDYHNLPVAPFGVANPDLLVVGLAPGKHGANATGRPFTGDHAGILLYQTLFKFGFSNQAQSTGRRDGLKLRQCRITNAVKCLPPENKPSSSEVNACNDYLSAELKAVQKHTVLIALGLVAHKAIIRALELKQSDYVFKHNAAYSLTNKHFLIDSYHCSRYNTNTKRLTEKMFHDVFAHAQKIIDTFN